MLSQNTKTGLQPLNLADAIRITAIRCEAARSLDAAIREIEDILKTADLLGHWNAADGCWDDETRTLMDYYHSLQNALLELDGGQFDARHDASRFVDEQQKRAAGPASLGELPLHLRSEWALY